jgi:D-xylulose reductase
VASDFVYPLPTHMSAEDGALVEPVAVAVQITKVANLRAGQTVVVFGCGPIGILCQAVAKAAGASKVIGVDISEARAAFAEDFAADGVHVSKLGSVESLDPMDASRLAAKEIVDKFDLGEGADVVLECTGAEPCIQQGIFASRKGGTYVQAGMGKENVVFPITTACIRGLTVKGSIRYSTGCYPRAVQLIASGQIRPRKLISHRFKFEQAEEAFELVKKAQENTLKVIIEGVK